MEKKLTFFNKKVYDKLPIIFGDQKNFSSFFNKLNKLIFSLNQIKAFYYFDIGRWDIVLKNNKTIKLPKTGYMEVLSDINLILEDNNFLNTKFLITELKDQLILE